MAGNGKATGADGVRGDDAGDEGARHQAGTRERRDVAHVPGACGVVDLGITRVFELLGKRWTGPIIAVLMTQPAHFADLRRAVPGISERMLSDRLTELAGAGLVVREVAEGPPLRVSYRLTDAGAELGPALAALRCWGQKYLLGGAEREPGTGC
ncbi:MULTISPECIES: winged helix-turn-helix transcriptional regulator [Streptomyces]|uniref:HTH hxlR-type domain-containing protein n=1 Tax=Streptomyces diastaticus subsp. diastaticus TaxID=68040 RepID=A0ABQ1CIL8_STRDI|nr:MULTISPECIES: helix-turn-helix domain-containing protein [Streptomyces]NEE42099.1 helix-turn-helix transcriptional regulator [Streptomyces sp. SID7982]WSU36842.1 helix-turn-helix transcriptional regulator [Streptomyces gougerotii]MBL3805711.1 helix-turn-helix transcriptional regulator [Streptomyces sp. BRB081]RPK90221.1 HTH-type transcriptional regulator YodB [Streptomyces sp. ADI98-12]WPR52056.1 helix-turn-helix domain-containing protein [Streptomyces sp. S399]